jgi:hypothetical protein
MRMLAPTEEDPFIPYPEPPAIQVDDDNAAMSPNEPVYDPPPSPPTRN